MIPASVGFDAALWGVVADRVPRTDAQYDRPRGGLAFDGTGGSVLIDSAVA